MSFIVRIPYKGDSSSAKGIQRRLLYRLISEGDTVAPIGHEGYRHPPVWIWEVCCNDKLLEFTLQGLGEVV